MATMLSGATKTQEFLASLRTALTILFAGVLLLIGWITASSFVGARRAEVGVLRAVGWRRREVAGSFALQFAAQGALVGLLGTLISVIATLVLRAGGGVTVLGVPWEARIDGPFVLQVVALILGSVLCFALAGLLPVARISSTPPDDVLRDVRT